MVKNLSASEYQVNVFDVSSEAMESVNQLPNVNLCSSRNEMASFIRILPVSII